MEKKTIREIADKLGFGVVETTSKSNGYPSEIKTAITGFCSEEEARKVAEEEGLDLIWLDRRDGWQLWHRGNEFTGALNLDPEDIGASFFAYSDEDVYNELTSYMEGRNITCDAEIEMLERKINNCKDALDYIRQINEDYEEFGNRDKFVYAVPYFPNGNGFGYQTQVGGVINWSYDTKHHIVAAIRLQ